MDFLECGICHIPYNEDNRRPHNSPCGHEFCSTCLKELIKDGEYVCPKCREKNRVNAVEDLRINFGLIDVIRAFKANTISLTNEATVKVLGASDEDVCTIHGEAISDWCSSCQLWICTECLDSHTSLIGCSTTSLDKSIGNLKDDQNINVDKVLDKFKEDTKYVTSKIQEHSDKKKEYLAIAEKHGEEVKKLQQVLSEGNNHKEKLMDAKKCLNQINSPLELSNSIKVVSLRKQTLISWSAKNIEAVISSTEQLLQVLERGSKVYVEKNTKNVKRLSKISQHQQSIFVHTFQKHVIDSGSTIMPADQLEKIMPHEPSLVFFELSLGGVRQGKLHVRLDKNLQNIRKYIVQLMLGEHGKSLNGISLNHAFNYLYNNTLSFDDVTFTHDKNGQPRAKRGDLFGNFNSGYLREFYFENSSTPNNYTKDVVVFGSIEDGIEVLQVCYENHSRGVEITDCGVIIENC